jgi:hypothetical protein
MCKRKKYDKNKKKLLTVQYRVMLIYHINWQSLICGCVYFGNDSAAK